MLVRRHHSHNCHMLNVFCNILPCKSHWVWHLVHKRLIYSIKDFQQTYNMTLVMNCNMGFQRRIITLASESWFYYIYRSRYFEHSKCYFYLLFISYMDIWLAHKKRDRRFTLHFYSISVKLVLFFCISNSACSWRKLCKYM